MKDTFTRCFLTKIGFGDVLVCNPRAVIDAGGAATFNELIRDVGKKMGAGGLRMTQSVKVRNPLSVE